MEKKTIFSVEYYQYLSYFEGLPISIRNPYINNYQDSIHCGVERTVVSYGSPEEWELVMDYISDVDYEEIHQLLDEIQEEENLLQSYYSQAPYSESLRAEMESDYDSIVARKKYALECNAIDAPSDFKGYAILGNQVISVIGDTIASISVQNDYESVELLYGQLDQEGYLKEATIAEYDYYDFTLNPDWDIHYLDCTDINAKMKELEERGIAPKKQLKINFQDFLRENGLVDTYDLPVLSLYRAKDSIHEKLNGKEYKKD